MRSAPAAVSRSATSLAAIGSRPSALRSWREYPYSGQTAVMRLADARLAASSITSCSMIEPFTGSQWLWMMKTSAPRSDSLKRQCDSPFGNVRRFGSPSSTPRCRAMSSASAGWQPPEYTSSFFLVTSSSIRRPLSRRRGPATRPQAQCRTAP